MAHSPKLIKPLNAETFQAGLKTKSFGRPIFIFSKIASTNDAALAMAVEGALEGTVVSAEVQTKGRGRQGRRWTMTPGLSLAFSLILRPRLHPDELAEITLAAAVAAAKTLEDYGLKPRIKWPNDILLDGKKVCGILTELGPKKDKILSVILGMGMNLNQGTRDFPADLREIATSFYRVSGKKIDRTHFFQTLLGRLEETYGWVSVRKFSKVLVEWRKRAVTLGEQVKVTQADKFFYGQVVDLDEKGALLVRSDVGIVERVVSGDVEVLKAASARKKKSLQRKRRS
jgi:BirA family biotin operon repressor/biotin-[acetyl-CoA-carboxylase] ligase